MNERAQIVDENENVNNVEKFTADGHYCARTKEPGSLSLSLLFALYFLFAVTRRGWRQFDIITV